MLTHMFPGQSAHCTANSAYARAIRSCKLGLGHSLLVLVANIAHDVFCQLCTIVLFAACSAIRIALEYLAALCGHVKRIRRVIAEKQVVGPHTGRVITVVTDKYLGRNRAAIRQHPRHARGLLHAPLVVDTPIPMSVLCGCPYPTRVATPFSDIRPKPLFNRRIVTQIRARWGMRAVRGFAAGAKRGRLTHVGSSFVAIGHATGGLQPRRGFVMPSIITQVYGTSKPQTGKGVYHA